MRVLSQKSITNQLFPTNSSSGQTLIEVVIAAGMIVLVLVTLSSGVAIGIRNNRIAKDQARSKDYVREGLEWARNMRDQNGWETFASITKNGTYCLSSLPANATQFASKGLGGCGSNYITGTNFARELTFTKGAGTPPTQMTIVAAVKWTDGAKDLVSTSTLTLYQWK